jgi:hypothetical protein
MGIWLSLEDSVCIQVQPSVEFPFPLEGCAAAPCFEGITHKIFQLSTSGCPIGKEVCLTPTVFELFIC